ncbi:MAG: hypothetical protein MJZ78_05285 [Bacteroidales bacterium]|nr:hypothetical protein [Bacteroidales bacterium]
MMNFSCEYINPGDTLVILDEIQYHPVALTRLKVLTEDCVKKLNIQTPRLRNHHLSVILTKKSDMYHHLSVILTEKSDT